MPALLVRSSLEEKTLAIPSFSWWLWRPPSPNCTIEADFWTIMRMWLMCRNVSGPRHGEESFHVLEAAGLPQSRPPTEATLCSRLITSTVPKELQWGELGWPQWFMTKIPGSIISLGLPIVSEISLPERQGISFFLEVFKWKLDSYLSSLIMA